MSEKQADYLVDAAAMTGKGYAPSSSIVRVRKDARFFVASNVPFNDKRLSWEARGVMGYLLSKPDAWETRMGDLVNQGPAGMKFIRRVLAELRLHGYMKREQVRITHGKWAWVTTLYESPELNNSTMLPLGIDGSAIDGQGVDIESTDLSFNDNKEIPLPSEQKPVARFDVSEVESNLRNLVTLYQSNIGPLTPMLADALKDAAQTYPLDFYAPAFQVAVENNKRNWAYIRKVMQNKMEGVDAPPKRTPYAPRQPKTPLAPAPLVLDSHGMPVSF